MATTIVSPAGPRHPDRPSAAIIWGNPASVWSDVLFSRLFEQMVEAGRVKVAKVFSSA